MDESVKITTTGTVGWQKKCWTWAQEREPFEVHDVKAKHLAFCKEICGEFHYECQYDSRGESAAIFTPI